MAITNTQVSTDANVTENSRGTAPGAMKRLRFWKTPPIYGLLDMQGGMVEVPQGNTSYATNAIEEFSGAATFAENALITATAIPANTNTSATLVSFGIATSISSEAIDALDDPENFVDLVHDLAVEDMWDFLAYDGTNGVSGLQASITDVTDNTGAALTWAPVGTGSQAIRGGSGDMELGLLVDDKGVNDLIDDAETVNASIFANSATTEYINKLIIDGGLGDDIGFTGIKYRGVYVFKVNRTSQLYANGGDTHGLLMPFRLPNGVQGPITICGRTEPSKAKTDARFGKGDGEMVASMGPVGIASWIVDTEEDVVKRIYKAIADAMLSNTNLARNIQYAT